MRLTLAPWSANPTWMPKKPNEMFHSPQKPSSGLVLVIPPPSRSIVLPPPHALTIGARRHPEAFVEPRGEMRRAREAEAVGDVGDRRARRQYSPRRKVKPVGAGSTGEIHAQRETQREWQMSRRKDE